MKDAFSFFMIINFKPCKIHFLQKSYQYHFNGRIHVVNIYLSHDDVTWERAFIIDSRTGGAFGVAKKFIKQQRCTVCPNSSVTTCFIHKRPMKDRTAGLINQMSLPRLQMGAKETFSEWNVIKRITSFSYLSLK